jgi:hypothetical protein
VKNREIDSMLGGLIALVHAVHEPGLTPAKRAKREQTLAERHEAVRDKISDALDVMRERFLNKTGDA